MNLVQVIKRQTNDNVLCIKITKDRQTIFRDLPWIDSNVRKIRRTVVTGMKGKYINYVTLEPIEPPFTKIIDIN